MILQRFVPCSGPTELESGLNLVMLYPRISPIYADCFLQL